MRRSEIGFAIFSGSETEREREKDDVNGRLLVSLIVVGASFMNLLSRQMITEYITLLQNY